MLVDPMLTSLGWALLSVTMAITNVVGAYMLKRNSSGPDSAGKMWDTSGALAGKAWDARKAAAAATAGFPRVPPRPEGKPPVPILSGPVAQAWLQGAFPRQQVQSAGGTHNADMIRQRVKSKIRHARFA